MAVGAALVEVTEVFCRTFGKTASGEEREAEESWLIRYNDKVGKVA